ncbi:glycosyl transferase family 2 [Aliiruegeria haliotis]|uniref:Glycosyl transferase family 2 n=1 Tax=Aliiruegeria haliotis TaxID=1280846 RepID=A0A2T0RJ45_9RHOB|nr:glycosyltransferase [Aliiruegeria haliotis]PRY21199.1 glycosyl transferase family 2 [Aliiruegeria haliotis]
MDSPDPTPKISVIIAHLNQLEDLARCLEALVGGNRTADEIIVVDNGSITDPEEVCRRFPSVRLLREPTPGPGPARSLGARAASGTILAFTDADCIPSPGWLAAVDAGLRAPDRHLLGGEVQVGVSDPRNMTAIEAYEAIFGFQVERYIRDMGFTVTCNLAMRSDVFDAVGPFGGLEIAEDRDWGRRAVRAGYHFAFVPEMLVVHPARVTFAQLRAKWDRQMGHDFEEARRSATGRLGFLLKALAMPVSILAALPRILTTQRVSSLENRWRAFFTLCRIRLYRALRMFWLLAGGDPRHLSGAWNRR